MRLYYLLIILNLLMHPLTGQTHFSKFKKIKYTSIPFSFDFSEKDSTFAASLAFSKIPSLKNFRIEIKEIKNSNSGTLFVYKKEKIIHKILIPNYSRHISPSAYLADIDGNKIPDIKLFINNPGNGLAALLSTKMYLFNLGEHFKTVSFFDFSTESEYDLNGDGIYEIIGKNHIYKNNRSYWVHNVYDFKIDTLINVSKRHHYPLWTKHLYTSSNVVTKNISYSDRLKEFRVYPDSLIIIK